jgi:hypothetical protein
MQSDFAFNKEEHEAKVGDEQCEAKIEQGVGGNVQTNCKLLASR